MGKIWKFTSEQDSGITELRKREVTKGTPAFPACTCGCITPLALETTGFGVGEYHDFDLGPLDLKCL